MNKKPFAIPLVRRYLIGILVFVGAVSGALQEVCAQPAIDATMNAKRGENFNAIAVDQKGIVYSASFRIASWGDRGQLLKQHEPFDISRPTNGGYTDAIDEIEILNATQLQVTSMGSYLSVMDVSGQKNYYKKNLSGSIVSIDPLPDERFFVVSTSKVVYVFDIFDLERPREFSHNGAKSATVSTDGSQLLIGHKKGAVEVFDLTTGTKTGEFIGHSQPVKEMATSPDGIHVLSISSKELILWNLQTKRQIAINKEIITTGDRIFFDAPLAFTPDGAYAVAAVSGNTIDFLSLKNLETIYTLTDPNNAQILDLAFDYEFKYLYSSGGGISKMENGSVRNYDGKITRFNTSRYFTPSYYRNYGMSDVSEMMKYVPAEMQQGITQKITETPDFFKGKGEFETTDAYALREEEQINYMKYLHGKYHALYLSRLKEKVKNSHFEKEKSGFVLGAYNADQQVYHVMGSGRTFQFKIAPAEAQSLKANFEKVAFKSEWQLDLMGTFWQEFNFKFVHPTSGTVFYLEPPRDPNYFDHVAQSQYAEGLPKLEAIAVFAEPSGNNMLDGGEEATLDITIKNTGKGRANKIRAQLSGENLEGVAYTSESFLDQLEPGTSHTINIPLKADLLVKDTKAKIKIQFDEANGFIPAPMEISFGVQSFRAPKLVLRGVAMEEKQGNNNKIIDHNELIEVTVLVQNIGQGVAKDVQANFLIKDPNIVAIKPDQLGQSLAVLNPGQNQSFSFTMAVNTSYTGNAQLPIQLALSERHQQYGGTYPLGLEMRKMMLTAQIIEVEGEAHQAVDIKNISFRDYAQGGGAAEAIIGQSFKIEPEKIIHGQKRVALVIGNTDYTVNAKLKNPANDANLMAETLSKLGFEVTVSLNADINEMRDLVKAYVLSRFNADVSLFYFAGHGMQVNNKNYLIPTDAKFENGEASLLFEAINVEMLTERSNMANQKALNIIILDACRNNPFKSWARGGDEGLAPVLLMSGTLVAYATAPGSFASDGDGKNGLYTGELAKQLLKYQRIEDVFYNTRNQVEKKSANKQSPWELHQLRGAYYLTTDEK